MKNKRFFIISGVALIVLIIAAFLTIQLLNKNTDAGGMVATQTPEVAPSQVISTDPGAVETSKAAPSPEKQKTTTIELGIWPAPEQTEEVKLHEGYTAKMKELHPDVTVAPSPYKFSVDSFTAMAHAGTLPTIFEGWFVNNTPIYDSLADITDELAARGWNEAMNPSLRDILSRGGRIYGLPRDGYALGLMMNVNLFKKAGLVDEGGYPLYPKTTDELVKIAEKIKDTTGKAGICILAKDLSGSWQYVQIAWNFGATLVIPNDDGTFTANLESKEAIAAMNFIKDLKWKYDVLTADPASEDWNTGFTALGKGEAAMYIGADDGVNQPTQVNGLPPDKLAMCAFPAGPKGDAYCMMGGTTYFFSKNATPDEINACLDYLEIMGKGPVASDEAASSMRKAAQEKAASGIPIIPRFPCWVNKELLDAETTVINEFANVDARMFEPYVNAVRGTTHKLRVEEPGSGSALYLQLFDVLHAVITNKNADTATLMRTADSDLQLELDQQFQKKK